jgi:hypothetical protein
LACYVVLKIPLVKEYGNHRLEGLEFFNVGALILILITIIMILYNSGYLYFMVGTSTLLINYKIKIPIC